MLAAYRNCFRKCRFGCCDPKCRRDPLQTSALAPKGVARVQRQRCLCRSPGRELSRRNFYNLRARARACTPELRHGPPHPLQSLLYMSGASRQTLRLSSASVSDLATGGPKCSALFAALIQSGDCQYRGARATSTMVAAFGATPSTPEGRGHPPTALPHHFVKPRTTPSLSASLRGGNAPAPPYSLPRHAPKRSRTLLLSPPAPVLTTAPATWRPSGTPLPRARS